MPHAETTVTWRCNVCDTSYPTEAKAFECERLPLEGNTFDVGDQFAHWGTIWVWREDLGYAKVDNPPIFTVADKRVISQESRNGVRSHMIEYQLVNENVEPFYKLGRTLRNLWVWVNPIKGSSGIRKPHGLPRDVWKWAQATLVKERESRAEMPDIPTYRGPTPEERLLSAVFGEKVRIK